VLAERALHTGDEIRLGATRLVFRAGRTTEPEPPTRPLAAAPELTRRERDVLLAPCRPVLSGDVFTQPASIRQIAEDLVVSEAAVKQHLARQELAVPTGQTRIGCSWSKQSLLTTCVAQAPSRAREDVGAMLADRAQSN
jgi:hypothetical protein